MRFVTTLSALWLACLCGVQASEQPGTELPEGEPEQPLDWYGSLNGDVEVGFLYTKGNTDSFSIRTNSELTHELEYFRNRYQLSSLIQKKKVTKNGQRDTVTSASRYGVTGQSNYKFVSGQESVFGRGAYLYDKFGAFHQQASLVAGYGNRVYEKFSDYLDLETGPGFAHQEKASGDRNTGLIWFLAMNLDYALYEGTKFRQTFEGNISLDGQNSVYLSRSSITARINGSLSMRFNFIAKYNSSPEDSLENMDTETSASLVYQF